MKKVIIWFIGILLVLFIAILYVTGVDNKYNNKMIIMIKNLIKIPMIKMIIMITVMVKMMKIMI